MFSKPKHQLAPKKVPLHLDRSAIKVVVLRSSWALQLPERLFVELARDLYDEVDRRECEAVWLGGGASLVGADRQAVPFLPVSPELSSTRNQVSAAISWLPRSIEALKIMASGPHTCPLLALLPSKPYQPARMLVPHKLKNWYPPLYLCKG